MTRSLHAGQAYLAPLQTLRSRWTIMCSHLTGIASIACTIDIVGFLQSQALGHASRGEGIAIAATHWHIVCGTVAWQTRVANVHKAWQATLLLCAGDLAGKAAAEIALQIEGGTVPEAATSWQHTVCVGVAGQGLTLLDVATQSAPADDMLGAQQLSPSQPRATIHARLPNAYMGAKRHNE